LGLKRQGEGKNVLLKKKREKSNCGLFRIANREKGGDDTCRKGLSTVTLKKAVKYKGGKSQTRGGGVGKRLSLQRAVLKYQLDWISVTRIYHGIGSGMTEGG